MFSTCNTSLKVENNDQDFMKEEEENENVQEKIQHQSKSQSNFNWIYLCSDNNIENYEPDDNVMKIVSYQVTPIFPNNNSIVHLYTGLFMTDDGSLRSTTSLDAVCFGFEQSQVERIEESKKLKVINIYFKAERVFQQTSYDDAINFAYRTNQVQFQQIAETIKDIQGAMNSYEFINESFGDLIITKLDEEYEYFKQLCFEFLEKYTEQNPNAMFKYNIERFNLYTQDCEHTLTGYSKSFLELIGLDSDSLIQLFHRHKRIDLIQNKLDITLQTILCLGDIKECHNPPQVVVSYIVTFDGFPIRLHQTQKTIQLGFEEKVLGGEDPSYFLRLNEIDVDLFDLEQLITYRQNLIKTNQTLSIEDFIRKELSFLFEDVEYSIYSQSFLDRFYNTNIQSLQQMKQEKLDQKITCKYKFISDLKN